MTQQSPQITRRFWVEKTIIKNRPDRQDGDHALGKALWSPHKAEDGKNIYYNMLSLKPDDIVFHFIDNERIEGYSIVAEPADSSFVGITGTDWGDRPAYRVQLRDHHKLDPPIERDEFLQNSTYQPLLKNLLDSEEGLFFNRKFNANQGAYLTQAPLRLVQIWNDINLQKTGRAINPDWNIPPLSSLEPHFGLADVLRRYSDEKIVFTSSVHQVRYAVVAYDQDGVNVERLDGNEPQRVTFPHAERLLKRVQEARALDFASLDNTSAVRNAVVQAEQFALTADRKTIRFLSDQDARLQNFLEVLEKLKMTHPLYKPVMLLCVLDGIDSRDLPENRITFDWVAPRFIAKMKSLGVEVGEQQAAQPFYHLSGDLFWMHSVRNLRDLMQDGGDGPSAARNRIRYALMKETYWNLLQDAASRTAVRSKLQSFMIPKISLDQIIPAAETAFERARFFREADLVRRFLCALASKPFVILTGNSGTGKTRLAELFVKWLCGAERNFALVPVGADWTDNRNVLGFVNHIRETVPADGGDKVPIYQSTKILDLLLEASLDTNSVKPIFLILDEMNLSHVERYFADFLSALESRDAGLHLHREGKDRRMPRQPGGLPDVPETLRLPRNVFVIGTVNVDETTYMFSPKVLDRANVIEFRVAETAPKEFLEARGQTIGEIEPAPPGYAEAFLELHYRACGFNNTQPLALLTDPANLPPDANVALGRCREIISDLFSLMKQRHQEFAFRSMAEIIRFLAVDYELAPKSEPWSWEVAMDSQILQKILPKLHGSKRKIGSLLAALAKYCQVGNRDEAMKLLANDVDADAYASECRKVERPAVFKQSYRKLCEMLLTVHRDQFVSFIQ